MKTLRERYNSNEPESKRSNTYTPEEVLAEVDMSVKANRRLVKLYLDAIEEISNLKSSANSISSNVSILQKILDTVEQHSVLLDVLNNDISNVDDKIDDVKSGVASISASIGIPETRAWNTTLFKLIDDLPSQIG